MSLSIIVKEDWLMMCSCGTHKREQVWVSVVIPGGCWEVPLMPSRLNLPQLGCADRPRASEAATGGLNSVTPLPLLSICLTSALLQDGLSVQSQSSSAEPGLWKLLWDEYGEQFGVQGWAFTSPGRENYGLG